MARRRYVSTTISQDTRINKLAIKHGDFAALLYTWMIPHAADDATLPGDPEELLYQVLPGRRDKTEADVRQALDGMAALGLIIGTDDGRIMFPPGTLLENTNQAGRSGPEYRQWRAAVLDRDNHMCDACGTTEGPLFAHHIKQWAMYPDLRFEVSNGVTLCKACHRAAHGWEA